MLKRKKRKAYFGRVEKKACGRARAWLRTCEGLYIGRGYGSAFWNCAKTPQQDREKDKNREIERGIHQHQEEGKESNAWLTRQIG